MLRLVRKNPQLAAVAAIFAVATATIAGAFIFQALGYAPCDLCLKQRIPYYVAIPFAALALAFAAAGFRNKLPIALVVLALIFFASMIFGIYHAGVEWSFWTGPSDCTGDYKSATSTEDFLQRLQTVKVVRCDAVAIRILGLSLAGWNAVVSAFLVALAVIGLRATRQSEKPVKG